MARPKKQSLNPLIDEDTFATAPFLSVKGSIRYKHKSGYVPFASKIALHSALKTVPFRSLSHQFINDIQSLRACAPSGRPSTPFC